VDIAATALSHELTEAITDPLLNAWYGTDLGHEIGDLCAYYYGYESWGGGLANEFWDNLRGGELRRVPLFHSHIGQSADRFSTATR